MKRQQRAIATRELILDCAEIEFFRASTNRTTLNGIACASGMTRGAIYGHFANKYELVHAIFARSALPLDPFTIPEFSSVNSWLGALRESLVTCMRDVLQDGRKRRLYGIAHAVSITDAECFVSRNTVRDASEFAKSRIQHALNGAVKAGEILTLDSSKSISAYIHACLTGYFLNSLLSAAPKNADEQAASVVAYALSAIGACVSSAS